mmetsp:Transcript_20822/g.32033  ORF Transcript_20822/g.32033 Transcript_20822/m.32033 type:complete len:175 (+) Transcript_20822:440-964(+)
MYGWFVERIPINLRRWEDLSEVGETVEHAVQRELQEELGVTLTFSSSTDTPSLLQPRLELVGIYSDPRRDNRRHTVSVVYHIDLPPSKYATPQARDDVKDVIRIPIVDLDKYTYFADHWTILMDYRRQYYHPHDAPQEDSPPSLRRRSRSRRTSDFAPDIVRSTCSSKEVPPYT